MEKAHSWGEKILREGRGGGEGGSQRGEYITYNRLQRGQNWVTIVRNEHGDCQPNSHLFPMEDDADRNWREIQKRKSSGTGGSCKENSISFESVNRRWRRRLGGKNELKERSESKSGGRGEELTATRKRWPIGVNS